MSALRTRWLLRRVPDWPNDVAVELVVDTTAPTVVEAIEQAAASNGIELQRMRGCGHDGWQAGCPECEREAELAGKILARTERGETIDDLIARDAPVPPRFALRPLEEDER
jgi:hypothetical protein